MKRGLIILIITLFLIPSVLASDVVVWQGQYYTGTKLNSGIYEFNFTVYDNLTEGNICYSNTTSLIAGNFGEWKTEQWGVNSACNNISKDYFLNIKINGIDQTPRKRLTSWDFLRKNVGETSTGNLLLEGTLYGLSPLKMQDEINFIKSDGTVTSALYNAPREASSTLSSVFADSLIHDIIQETNDYGMQECFWDENTKTMQMCISGAYLSGRATTISRSVQIVGNTTSKPVNERFTLCEGNNYVDCKTDTTGADLLVQDDIEAIGSIFSQENITASHFIGDGSYLTGMNHAYGEMYSNTEGTLTMITQNTWYNITGFSMGLNNGWYLNPATNELICNLSGIYEVAYNYVLTINSNDEIEIQIKTNNIADAKSLSRDTFTGNKYQTMSNLYLQNYSAGDRLIMQIRDVTAHEKITTIKKRNLMVNKIG